MKVHKIQYAISALAIILIVTHLIFPSLSVDSIIVALVIIAVLPWLGPIFRSFEFPGGFKVEYQEFLRAEMEADAAGLLAPIESDVRENEYSFQLIQKSNPNLALAGLRLEIETRLRRIAEANDISVMNRSAHGLVALLVNDGIFQKREGQVIQELLRLLNPAVHGAEVEPRTVEWAIEIGPRILHALDQRLGEPS
jgi:hypothetical protein